MGTFILKINSSMARVTLNFPESPIAFSAQMQIRVTDLNYGNHLGNDAVLSLVHEARVRFLQHLGDSELDIGGCGIIMADATIVFKNEGLLGYQVVIDIQIGEISRSSFELFYRLSAMVAGIPIDIAWVKTGIVCYDYTQQKIATIPTAFAEKLSSFQKK